MAGDVILSWNPAKDVIEWWSSQPDLTARPIVSLPSSGPKVPAILPLTSRRK
jgi:hypothetical protein